MSGHSKWHTIKHKKALLDARRGKLWTRIVKEIVIAARSGGDPAANPRLRTAITAAKAVSMPADNIKRAIQRGTGELGGDTIEEITFEGYGPGGAAFMIATATDNRNRTVSELRHMFTKHGGNMGAEGAVAWMFDRKSQILIEGDKVQEDRLMEVALEAGAEDIRQSGDNWEVLSDIGAHFAVMDALEKAGIPVLENQGMALIPKNLTKVEGADARAVMRFYDAVEEHDDVQNVYANFELDEAELEEMGA